MNEESSSNIPPMPGMTEVPEFLRGDNWFGAEIDNDFLNFEEPYRPPRYTLARNGVPFANVGELHVISGKPGNGKTGLMSQLMATVLCGRFGNTESQPVPRKVKDTDTGEEKEVIVQPIVLYIDTEQGKDDTIAIKNRVCSLANIDYTKPNKQFFILRLRDTEEALDRWRKILKAVYMVRPTDIFLDGMLDIVKDYNDQVECQPIIRKSMMLATYYDASLWMVLHENPLVDKLVGTLGSIVQRKVAEIFTVIKVKQQDLKPNDRRADLPEIYFKVKQVKARGRDVGDWLFEYIQNAGGWGMPVELDDNGAKVIDDDNTKKWMKECDERFKSYNWTSGGATYTDLERHLANQGVSSNRKKGDLINAAKEFGILTTTGTKGHFKYHYNGLKDLPNDEAEAIPFDKPDGDGQPPF